MSHGLSAVFLAFALTAASAAQPPGPAPLAGLRLHDGFTLTYAVTVRDTRSAALRLKNVADQRKGIAEELASGLMTPQQAAGFETQAASLGDHRPDEHFDITLSARDGKLLYLSTRGGRYLKEKIKDAILLDGDKAYEAVGSEAVSIENDAWRSAPVYRGENVDRLGFFPLPALGLPNVDLIQHPGRAVTTAGGHLQIEGAVPRFNIIEGGETPYKPGVIEAVPVGGTLRVLSLKVGSASVPQQSWAWTAFQRFQGQWLGTKMRMVGYEEAAPSYTADYALTEARSSAAALSAFEITSSLADGATVTDSSDGNTFAFHYSALGGSLAQQEQRARLEQGLEMPKKQPKKQPETPSEK